MIFIDELPHINDNTVPMAKAACIKIQFLRNLCRLVKLPANLSGTNSKVNNLIGNGTVAGSRLGERETKPWVQVTVKSTKSSVKSFASLIKYKDHRSVDRSFGRVVSQPGYSVNYPLLISDLYGIQETPSPTNDYLHVGKLIKFIIEQSKTSLSGIIPLIMKKLFQVLPTTSNSKELWRNLWQKVVDDIRIRKPSLNTAEGLLACAHILTMPSVLREVLEIGPYSASLVENHLFYYGTADETTFRLNYMLTGLSANILKLVRVGEDGKISLHEDKCHFPEVEKDFLTTFICMNIWNEAICKVERGESDSAAFTHSYPGSRRCSLASLYQEYLESFKKYRTHSSKTIADSFALEILAFWSICHASHQDFCGETGGVQMFEEFVKNLQCIDSIEGNVTTYAIMKGLEALPTTLSNFLTTRVSVPFLLRYEGESMAHVIHSVSSFIKLGKAYIPDDKIGWDVLFDLEFDGSPAVGFIECKLWARSIGYSTFYKYYKRSCMNGHPLSFLVCKNLQNSIAGPMAVGNLTAMLSEFISYSEEENEAAQINVATEDVIGYEDDSDYGPENESESENQNVTPPKRQKVNYIELFRQLWNDGYHIDIYTVKYDKTDQKFTVAALKTFPTPKGIFILVESTFDPPTRTSSL